MLCVQRKIETDDSSSEDIKKLRTAQDAGVADGIDGGARPAVGESRNSAINAEDSSGTADDGSPQQETTAVAEEDNGMSVDIVVEDVTTAASSSSADVDTASVQLPATAVQSVGDSSANDVIDVDAIDTENSHIAGHRDQPAGGVNPLELGLNEYYLKPASDSDALDDNVIDVDADSVPEAAVGLTGSPETAPTITQSSSLSASANTDVDSECVEVKPGGPETSVSGTNSPVTSIELRNDRSDGSADVTGVEVTSTEPVTASPSPPDDTSENTNKLSKTLADDKPDEGPSSVGDVEVENTEPEAGSSVSSSWENKTADVVSEDSSKLAEKPADDSVTADSKAEGSEPVAAASAECDDAADIGAMVTEIIDRVVADKERSTESAQVAVELQVTVEAEMDISDEPETLTASSVGDDEAPVVKPVETECVEEAAESRNETVIDSAAADVCQAEPAENTSQWQNENSTGASDGKDVADRTSSDGDYSAGVMAMTDKPVSDTGDSVAEVTEMADKPISAAEDINQSIESMDSAVADSKNVKESAGETNDDTMKTESIEHHADLEVQSVVTDDAVAVAKEIQSKDEDVDKPTEVVTNTKDVKDMVTDATKKNLVAETVSNEQPKDVAVSDNAEVTGKTVTGEEFTLQAKDVSHSNGDSRQASAVTSDVDNAEDVSPRRDVTDVAVIEAAENVAADGENETKDVAFIDAEENKPQPAGVTERMETTGPDDEAENDNRADAEQLATAKTVGGSVTQAMDVTEMLPAGDECNQQAVTDVTDKTETGDEDMELAYSDDMPSKRPVETAVGDKTAQTDAAGSNNSCTVVEAVEDEDRGGSHGGKDDP